MKLTQGNTGNSGLRNKYLNLVLIRCSWNAKLQLKEKKLRSKVRISLSTLHTTVYDHFFCLFSSRGTYQHWPRRNPYNRTSSSQHVLLGRAGILQRKRVRNPVGNNTPGRGEKRHGKTIWLVNQFWFGKWKLKTWRRCFILVSFIQFWIFFWKCKNVKKKNLFN